LNVLDGTVGHRGIVTVDSHRRVETASPALLAEWVADARARTIALYADVSDAALEVPYSPAINPPRWEMGHVAWFQEHWVLQRALGRAPGRPDAAALWNSAIVPHESRWRLSLPGRSETIAYLERVRDDVLGALRDAPDPLPRSLEYFTMLGVFHEDMHGEAFAYTRQNLGWPAPESPREPADVRPAGPWSGDATVPGGRWRLGAEPDPAPLFVFDNEKWAHDVELRPFRIARAPVTQAELAEFVDDRGYEREELWSEEGWAWRGRVGARHPLYWRRGTNGWERRIFDHWTPLAPHRPVIHVCCFEAEAFCKWARRRLPTEAEWERAAAGAPMSVNANLDMRRGDTVDVGAFPEGDSSVGCRQMTGNVWEWTATSFQPYPGFIRDPYAEYSEPWFGTHRVLRGGCFATRGRLLRPTWRNFYTTDRRDVWAGFRTCAIE
jgi:iron(II)-dependent oxidoreductase